MWPSPRRCRSWPSPIAKASMSKSSRNPRRVFWVWVEKTPLCGSSPVLRGETANGVGAGAKARAIAAPAQVRHRGRGPKTGHREIVAKDRGGVRDLGAARAVVGGPKPGPRKVRISVPHDPPVLPGTTEASDHLVAPNMIGAGSGPTAKVLPAHHERERQG